MSFDWSPENIEILRTLWAEGKSATEISKSMGLASRSAALGKLRRLGVYRDGPPARSTRQRRTSPGKVAHMREARRRRREAEQLEQEKMREPEHAHADFVRKRLRPISKRESAGYASKNLASRIETKLRTDDGGPKYPPSGELATEFRGLTLMQLGPNDCRWPHGDGPFTFCGRPKALGSSYCDCHQARSRANSGSTDLDVDRIAARAMGGIRGYDKSTIMET